MPASPRSAPRRRRLYGRTAATWSPTPWRRPPGAGRAQSGGARRRRRRRVDRSRLEGAGQGQAEPADGQGSPRRHHRCRFRRHSAAHGCPRVAGGGCRVPLAARIVYRCGGRLVGHRPRDEAPAGSIFAALEAVGIDTLAATLVDVLTLRAWESGPGPSTVEPFAGRTGPSEAPSSWSITLNRLRNPWSPEMRAETRSLLKRGFAGSNPAGGTTRRSNSGSSAARPRPAASPRRSPQYASRL